MTRVDPEDFGRAWDLLYRPVLNTLEQTSVPAVTCTLVRYAVFTHKRGMELEGIEDRDRRRQLFLELAAAGYDQTLSDIAN